MQEFEHQPVLLNEVLAGAASALPGTVVDCTVGGAGHARVLLEAYPKARLIGLDQDPSAVTVASGRLAPYGARAQVLHSPFSRIAEALEGIGVQQVQVVLADFGVSSHQLDFGPRGFSFRQDAPLDMRMNPQQGVPAHELIASLDERALAHAIATLGEERFARRVARSILAAKPVTTLALADAVRRVVPQSKDGIDPATRTFQAIRMLVNDELGEIKAWLAQVVSLLAPGGVVMAISFHSLEDRLVKTAFKDASVNCICPKGLPVCLCKHRAQLTVPNRKGWVATDEERRTNPRSRSARLRLAVKLAASDNGEVS